MVALVAVMGSTLTASIVVDGPDAAGPPVTQAPDGPTAIAAARAQGMRVEVLSERTPTMTVYAEPDGTHTAEFTTRPTRVARGGSWVDVDTTLVRRPDGSVGPAAAAVDLSFSGGGATAPMVEYGRDGHRITLDWPGRLPEPELAGDRATYPGVMPGVDLVLQADVDGYAQYLVVADAAAAEQPGVREIRLGLRTDGVELRTTGDGGIEARDGDGAVVFAAPASRMWDSASPRAEAAVAVRVTSDSLTLRPDRELLTSDRTVYPVTVDPRFHTADKHAWASPLSGKAGTHYWFSSGEPPYAQVGQCYRPDNDGVDRCNGIAIARSYFMFDTSFLAGMDVLGASFRAVVERSSVCFDVVHQIYKAFDTIAPNRSSWNTVPGGQYLGDYTAPHACDGAREVGVPVQQWVNRGGTTTFFIKARDEAAILRHAEWRKYNNNARLTVHYNRLPQPPTNVGIEPALPAPCHHCGGLSYMGDPDIRFRAWLSDPDGDPVRPLWHAYVDGARQGDWWGGYKPSGEPHDRPVDLRNWHNRLVDWYVKSDDGVNGDTWQPTDPTWVRGPSFVVDRVAPAVRPTVTSTLYQQDNRWHGGVGVPGTFVFGSTGLDASGNPVPVPDADHFLWGFDDQPTNKVNADALGGRATVAIAPPADGPQTLFVQTVDRAGHRSPTQAYHFYVRAGSGPLAQWSFEGNAEDEAFLGDRDGVPEGTFSYAPGAVGQALRLDGSTGHVTAPNVVRTDASFSVSAWVKLDSGGAARAVVSQDGNLFSGFNLWYRPDNGGRWTFGMANSNESPQGTDMAWSARPARVGVWTHLAGVYDHTGRTLRLYVDGVLSSSASRTVPGWHASGSVRIGRTMWNGHAAADFWPGLIDEVKVYDRVLDEATIRAAVGRDDVAASHWSFEELAGSSARNAVAGGEMAVLHHDATFTGDSDGDGVADGGIVGGAVRFDGTEDDVTTSGPAVDTDQSYTICAWVQVDVAPQTGNVSVAVSQDGGDFSGFMLSYRQLAAGGVWEFNQLSADAATRPADSIARSSQPAQLGTPTHLAAVYDAPAGRIRLYVNGQEAGSAASTGAFDANGSLAIARALWADGPTGRLTGMVDEVRAYSRELSAAEIRGIVSRDDVALGQWPLDGSVVDSSGNGFHGSMTGTPQWTGGQTGAPDPTDLAVRLTSPDSYLSAPHTVNPTRSFAVAVWARPDTVGELYSVVSQNGQAISSFKLRATPDGRWAFVMFNQDVTDGGGKAEVFGGAVQVGVWSHLVAMYDAASREISLYVNGVLAGRAPHTHTWDHPSGPLQIGRPFPGAIDDVTVYGRVLFADEIRTLAGRDLTLAHSWPFDEGSGGTTGDAVGRHAATLTSGATRVPGRLGNALAFNGTGGRAATGGVDLRTDSSFSVSAWVRLDQTCAPREGEFSCQLVAVSLDGAPLGATNSKFRLGHLADRGQFRTGVWVFEMAESGTPGAPARAAVTVESSDLGQWVHLAGVYDEPTDKLWLYVNGTRKGDATLSDPWHATGGLQMGAGRDAAGAIGQFFPGRVDDVRLYSGPLDDARISNLYHSYPDNAGTPALPAASAGHWRFDENTGTTAADSSGRGLTATLRNGAGWHGARIGYGLNLGGTNGFADTAGPVLDTTRSFSVSAWVYPSTTGSGERVVVGQDGGQVSGFQLRYQGNGNRWEAVVPRSNSAAAGLHRITSAETVYAGQWAHLAVVYDAPLQQLRLYVNGRLSAAQVGVVTWPATGPLAIARGKGIGGAFAGVVDDVRAYQAALSDGQLRLEYDDAYPAVHGSWHFNDDTVRDWSWRGVPTTASGTVAFGDGISGRALTLNGAGAATSTQLGVPAMGSLTVSAWARLTHEPAVQTVVAQHGTWANGFALQYRPALDRWVFAATTRDAEGADLVYATGGRPVVLGEWTHLTGVYDHAAGQLRLYVDGELAGSQDGVTLWHTWGGLTIGRGLVNGAPAESFRGAIDEVRTDLGVVPDAEIAVRAGFSTPPPGQFGRFVNAAGDQYTGSTSDPVRAGYRYQNQLGMPVADGPNTRLLYACRSGADGFTSIESGCENATRVGEVGRVFTRQPSNLPTMAIYRCLNGTNRYESLVSTCEGGVQQSVLGYALAYAVLARHHNGATFDHWSTTGGVGPGYRYEGTHGYLPTIPQPGTQQLMSCVDGLDQFNSLESACEGRQVRGGVGYVWTSPPSGQPSRPLLRCLLDSQRLTSTAGCEGLPTDRPLGHVLTALPSTTPVFP